MEYVVGVSVVTVLFGAVIASNRWDSVRRDALRKELMDEISRLAKIVDKLAGSVQHHHEDTAAHAHTDNLMPKDLCEAKVGGIKEAINTLATNTEKGFNFLAGLIKNGGK